MEYLRRFNIYSDGRGVFQSHQQTLYGSIKFFKVVIIFFVYFYTRDLRVNNYSSMWLGFMQIRYNHMRMEMQPSVTVTYLLYKV